MAGSAVDASAAEPKARSNTLRQAASAVFALTAVVPLLLFVWTVHHLGALASLQAQLVIGLALVVALVGFLMFRRLMGQMSDLVAGLRRIVELGERSAARASASATRAGVPSAAGAWARAGTSTPPATPSALSPGTTTPGPAASAPAVAPMGRAAAEARRVPGLGAIREVTDLSRAMVVLWRAEASGYKGRRVVLSVLNSPRPIVGTLLELSDDGLLIQTDEAERLAVSFDRLSAIDAEEAPPEL
jgi:hypothetical protein